MTLETFIWIISPPLAVVLVLTLIHRIEARRQRRQNWWRGR